MRVTRFTKKVRIDPKQIEWLKLNKDTRTVAGFLDKIINEHKKRKIKTVRTTSRCLPNKKQTETIEEKEGRNTNKTVEA